MSQRLFIQIFNNRKILSNFSYLAVLEIFILIAPLVTYPYLVKILGMDLYGWVITAQITASYCTIIIDFGFKRISARHIAINTDKKEKIGEVVSAILLLRFGLWILSFFLYFAVIFLIPAYRGQIYLFLFSFLTTLNSVLFLDFYFQGIENMKYITIVNIVVRSIFVAATFIIITKPSDYIYVPLLWSVGYILGGAISIWVVFIKHRIEFKIPTSNILKMHLKEGAIIFTSDAMLTIKDKLNYNIMGVIIGMSDIVIYDIGSKISNLLQKPVAIISTVLFPKMAKNPSRSLAKRTLIYIFICSCIMVGAVNIFMPIIVKFFINEDIDLTAIRLYSTIPIILGISIFISSNIFFATGNSKLVLKSTYITTIGYLLMLGLMYLTGRLNSVLDFVLLTVWAYAIELIYRLMLCKEVYHSEYNNVK